jgi:glycosyltransferase involved in cell wall biosynthesis
MKQVLALTAIEPPFRGRLVETQFLKPLARALRDETGTAWEYLSLSPFWYRFSRKNFLGEFRRTKIAIERIKKYLSSRKVRSTFVNLPYPWHPRHFNLRAGQAMVFASLAYPRLAGFLSLNPAQLIVARSYPAALLANLEKRFKGTPYIFDMRGLYPEEGLNAGVFEPESPDYRFWKRRELELISSAERCLVVSQPFAEHVRSLAPEARVSVIPCCVDTEEVGYDAELRKLAKKEHGLEGRFVLLHLGSFGTKGDRGLVAQYLKRFRRVCSEAILVAATGTPSFVPEIRVAFLGQGLSENDFRVINPGPDQLHQVRALGDAGLILERKVANTHACLSVKLGEYLASGLPVICTPHVEGAARLVERYECGLVVDPDDPSAPQEREKEFLKRYRILRENGFKLARHYLSLENCAALWRQAIKQALRST